MQSIEKIIKNLGEYKNRVPGSADERQAANYIISHLSSIRPTYVRAASFKSPPSDYTIILAHLIIIFLSGIISYLVPLISLILIIFSFISYFLWHKGENFIIRKYFTKNESSNILAYCGNINCPQKAVICVSYDDTKENSKWGKKLENRWKKFISKKPLLFQNPIIIPFAFAIVLLISTIFRSVAFVFDISELISFGLQFFQALSLIILALSIVWCAQIVIQKPVNTNAKSNNPSALMLMLAKSFVSHPVKDLCIIFLFAGARSSNYTGSREFVRDFSHLIDTEKSIFINIDKIDQSAIKFFSSESNQISQIIPYKPKINAELNSAFNSYLKSSENNHKKLLSTNLKGVHYPWITSASPFLAKSYNCLTLSIEPVDYKENGSDDVPDYELIKELGNFMEYFIRRKFAS